MTNGPVGGASEPLRGVVRGRGRGRTGAARGRVRRVERRGGDDRAVSGGRAGPARSGPAAAGRGRRPDRASGPEAGDLPLCGAACGGHAEVVGALLSAGAEPDLREEFGFTALRWAAGLGHAEVAEMLLAHGADPDLPGPQGEVPLVVAARRGSVEPYGRCSGTAPGTCPPRWTRPGACSRSTWSRSCGTRCGACTATRATSGGAPRAGGRRGDRHGRTAAGRGAVRRPGPADGARGDRDAPGAGAGAAGPVRGVGRPRAAGRGPGLDNWRVAVGALWLRGDEETFQAAAAWTASGGPAAAGVRRGCAGTAGIRHRRQTVHRSGGPAAAGAGAVRGPGPAGAAERALAGYERRPGCRAGAAPGVGPRGS